MNTPFTLDLTEDELCELEVVLAIAPEGIAPALDAKVERLRIGLKIAIDTRQEVV